ncbi:CotH kinase family protein [Prevotella sp. E2-28]|uniref:CotH kinase family protein n=1 Tax=Prevotella sp. E2-28 TaxID=2913620 RepID=UPI001ED9E4EC|nr:CotH kinase family protein [Prevotella sp. E2-28]UKK54887.1 CotH kinase family protein [Prevotella sp. E2-28]
MKFRALHILFFYLLTVLPVCAQYVQKTDLPTIYLETFDGNGIYSKDVYEYCRLHYVDETGTVTSYDSVSIRGRGNSTWNLSKKPYKLKFLNKEKFLGKGYAKAKKWTLLANAGDKTMIRNAVTSALGEFTSLKFNPAYKFVDMVLNNEYIGTYQISDQIDVRPHRVNITEQPYPISDTTDITGGYLLEVDGFKDGNYFISTNEAPITIHYPEQDEIDSKQTAYIKNYINNTFETSLFSQNFTNAETGYRAFVDTTSLIDWYLCTEISANIDGFWSTYCYKDRGDQRLFFGPLWDYDIAYNNDHRVQNDMRLQSSVNSLMADIAYSGSKVWITRMWEDPWFQKTVYTRYKELLDSGLVNYMQSKVDSLNNLLSQSQQMNYQKWGISRKMYHEVVLYSSYDQYISDLKSFITQHCEYLLNAFSNKKPAEPTPPFEPEDFYYRIVNAKTRKVIDVDNNKIVQYTNTESRQSQEWWIRKNGDHYVLINRNSGLALNDPTVGNTTATTNVGTQLNVTELNELSQAQQWDFIPQGTEGYYNLLNVQTQHIANLNGGNSNDYTQILSYTNDAKNSTSTNRMWFLEPSTALPYEITGVEYFTEPEEYALAYNQQTKTLHFGSETPAELQFPVRVYNASGRLIGTFRANEQFSMAAYPQGIYIATWNVSGKTRSVKFSR